MPAINNLVRHIGNRKLYIPQPIIALKQIKTAEKMTVLPFYFFFFQYAFIQQFRPFGSLQQRDARSIPVIPSYKAILAIEYLSITHSSLLIYHPYPDESGNKLFNFLLSVLLKE